jgi:decaprenyl-phosphate phosphoribosyltransferase
MENPTVSTTTKRTNLLATLKTGIGLLRVHQWVKNLFVLVPAYFAGVASDADNALPMIVGFFAYSFISSTGYIINDLFDKERDSQHPRKKNRPIASGRVSESSAIFVAIVLAISGLLLSAWVNLNFLYVVLAYMTIVMLYSRWLKHLPVVDILIISIGFLLRIYAGAAIVDVYVSFWLVAIVSVLSLYLGLGKRKQEIVLFKSTGLNTRPVIEKYSAIWVDRMLVLTATAIVLLYAFYTLSDDVKDRIGDNPLCITSIFVLIGVGRYTWRIMKKQQGGEPVRVIFRDPIILFSILGWIILFGIFLYG